MPNLSSEQQKWTNFGQVWPRKLCFITYGEQSRQDGHYNGLQSWAHGVAAVSFEKDSWCAAMTSWKLEFQFEYLGKTALGLDCVWIGDHLITKNDINLQIRKFHSTFGFFDSTSGKLL